VLLAHVLGVKRSWLLAHPEVELTHEQEQVLRDSLARLESGEPLPYVLGHWEFFGLDFALSPSVLIPRPETEMLVERALSWLRLNSQRRLAADIGTGSGCIAISLAVHVPDLQVIATDISAEVLEVARLNAARYSVAERINFLLADLLPDATETEAGQLDLICANLPYIPTQTLRELPVSRSEPLLALDGGPDGLAFIRRLLHLIPQRFSPGGLALVEIEASQGKWAQRESQAILPQASIQVLPDLAGKDRLLEVAVPAVD